MAIITKSSSVEKGNEIEFTLNITDLLAHASVSGDAYFSVQSNWDKVFVNYTSEGYQKEILIFNNVDSGTSSAANFGVFSNARDTFEVHSVIIMDKQGGCLKIKRSDLVAAEFDVIFAASTAGWSSTYYDNSAATLSNNNLTATIDSNTGQGIILYTDNQITYGGGEKVYKEITLNHRQNNTFFTIGMRVFNTVPSDFTPSNTADFNTLTDEVAELYWEGSSSSIKYSIDNGSAVNAGGGYPGFATNDVIMVALDTSVNKIWFGKNGAWIGGGNPATNSGGIDYAAAFAGVSNMNNIFIAVMDYDFGTPDPQFTINDSPLYTPAGFTEI